MVKVIDQPKEKETVCYKCRARLSYTFSEMKSSVESDYTGFTEKVTRITCPCCNTNTQVPNIF